MVEKGTNPLKLDNFPAFLESGNLTKLSVLMPENFRKYSDNFNKIVSNLHIFHVVVVDRQERTVEGRIDG